MISEQSPVYGKLLELCEAIANDTEFQANYSKVQSFFNDETARALYVEVTQYGEQLRNSQMSGVAPSQEDIAKFEEKRGKLLENEVAFGFLSGKHAIEELNAEISKVLHLTFELGRKPSEEDMEMLENESGCCGGGCGCGSGGCSDEGCGSGGCGCGNNQH